MPRYQVTGAHRDTGEDARFEVEAADVDHAARKANAAGYVVAMVNELGASSRPPEPESEAATRERMLELLRTIASNARPPERAEPHGDGALGFFAFFVPIVGIIAGSIRLANRDPSGTGVLVIATIGMVAYSMIVFGMLESAQQ